MNRLNKGHFWKWFTRHNKEYMELTKKSRKEINYWMDELNAHLRAYFKFLDFTLTLHKNGTAMLTISVNGKRSYFKKAEVFVDTAPEIAGWQITALDEAMPIDYFVSDDGIDPAEFYFSFASSDLNETNIILYHPLCTSENEHLFLQMARKAVYNLLGEWSFGMDIGEIRVDNLSAAGGREVLKLEKLAGCIGRQKSALVVDGSGRLNW